MNRLAIIGAGSWGTALACVLAPRFGEVRLWVYEQDLAERLRDTRENDIYLPGFRLPKNIEVHTGFGETLADAEVVLTVAPSHVTRATAGRMLPHLTPSMLFVSATKGLETGTLLRMSEVIRQVATPRFEPRVAVLSGPTFAREVAAGDATALVISSPDRELNETIQHAFSGPTFRLYTNSDPVGVELAAALKNVIAIGAGVCNGLGAGNNTVAALVARGLAEITRLAVSLGGDPRTLAGLAGLGDRVLTCAGALQPQPPGRRRLAAAIPSPSRRLHAHGRRRMQTAYAAMRPFGALLHRDAVTCQVNAISAANARPASRSRDEAVSLREREAPHGATFHARRGSSRSLLGTGLVCYPNSRLRHRG